MKKFSNNDLSICYSFNDSSHSMDAFVFTNCQWELLKLTQELADFFDLKIKIEVSAIEEGSVIQQIKLFLGKKAETVGNTMFISLVMTLLASPLQNWLTNDSELESLTKANIEADTQLKLALAEKAQLEVENLKRQNDNKEEVDKAISEIKNKVDLNAKVVKRISNFYESALKEPKIQNITINNNIDKQVVNRSDFNKYILDSNDLEPEIVEDAIIEIVSPVLKKGNYKWRGVYNGEPISFYMKSSEFKLKVQTGDIVFKNGDSIKCILEIERKIGNTGEIEIISYSVNHVLNYITDNKVTETLEGVMHRKIKKSNGDQLSFLSCFDKE